VISGWTHIFNGTGIRAHYRFFLREWAI